MKLEVKDFIFELLKTANLRNVHISGNNFSSQCPYHMPKHNTSAFGVNFLKQEDGYPFNCRSCGEHGNIFQLIMLLNNCDYDKAQSIFIKKVAISPITLNYIDKSYKDMFRSEIIDFQNLPIIELPPKHSPDKMIKYMKWRNDFEQHNVMDIEYIINRYRMYYCDSGRYSNRIIMPIRDIRGRNVFFTNRSIIHDSTCKNLFPQRSSSMNYLYGTYESLGKKKGMAVEGPFDMFQLKSYAKKHKLHDWGFICLMGTSLTDYRAGLIADLFEEFYIALDHGKDVVQWTKDKSGQSKLPKDYQMTNMLNEYLPTQNLTRKMHKGKEPSICSESQLEELFSSKIEKSLKISDYYLFERN